MNISGKGVSGTTLRRLFDRLDFNTGLALSIRFMFYFCSLAITLDMKR